MIDPVLYLAFLPAALALVITPGPDMMFALAQGLSRGRRAGIAAAAGISAGALINSALAGVGLGALVAAAPWLFGVVRWVGAAYLLWLAWKTLRTPLVGPAATTGGHAFRDGLIVNLSNPSVILFILALLPQFVDPSRPVLPQFLILGGTIAAFGFVAKSLVGVGAGGIAPALARSPVLQRALRWISAGIFGVLALRVVQGGLRP